MRMSNLVGPTTFGLKHLEPASHNLNPEKYLYAANFHHPWRERFEGNPVSEKFLQVQIFIINSLMNFDMKVRNFEPQSISVLILYFSVQVLTINMHVVTRYDTTNPRR